MAGLLDPTDDIVSPDERKAITQQNLFSTLLQSGMGLVAAGENILPWQRAQMIAQAAQPLGAMPANNQQMLANAAQQKLVGQKYADKKRESQILNSDDFKTALSQLPPEMQALARINPQGAFAAVSNYRQSQAQAQRDEAAAARQERLLQAQLDRQPPTVKNDEYGRLVAYDPTTRSWSLVNMGGGDQRSVYGLPGVVPAQQPAGGQPAPQSAPPPLQVGQIQPNGFAVHPNPNAPTNMPVPTAAGGTGQAIAVNNPSVVPPSINTQSVDYRRAFGLGGFSDKIAGELQDFVEGKMTGGNLEAANARNNYNQVRNQVLKVLTTGMPGRQSKYTTQMVSETLPEAGSAFQGKTGAVSKLDAANRMIESEIESLNAAFDAPGNIKMRADIAEKLKDLYRTQANLTAINQQITYGKSGAPQQARPAAGGAPTPAQALEELRRRGKVQ